MQGNWVSAGDKVGVAARERAETQLRTKINTNDIIATVSTLDRHALTSHFIRYTQQTAQISNQPITLQQLGAFRHVDAVTTTC